jgi:hypothetical protein
MDKPETLATLDTQVTERRQTKTKRQLRKPFVIVIAYQAYMMHVVLPDV